MCLVAVGLIGFGDTIWETERGRPLGMSVDSDKARDSRREEDDEECLLECLLEEEDDLLEDLSDGTSRMFSMRPVVDSVVEAWAGSWVTWYPSMM
jgi:hypothetical protein